MRAALLASLVLLAAPALALADNEECKKLCEEANDFDRKQEYEKALETYRRALDADPKSAAAQLGLGNELGNVRRFDEAIVELEKVPKLESPPGPLTATALTNLGNIWGGKGELEKAVGFLKDALKIDRENWSTWNALGACYSRLGKWRDALDAGERSLKFNPNQPELAARMERYRKALDDPENKSSELDASFIVPSIGGWVASPDLKTLTVSVPTRAELWTFDTLTKDEPRKATLDFQPGKLLLEGKSLLALAQGSAKLHVLDPETLKVQKTIKLPSELKDLACHRARTLVYGTTATGEVVSIDVASGKTTTTKAVGALVAVDPVKAAFVLTAGPDAKGETTVLRKYAVQGADLKLVETNPNVALRGKELHVSPDGKRVVVAGEGWRDPKGAGDASADVLAVFETDSILSSAGRVATSGRPVAIAFHPLLDTALVAGEKGLSQLAARSLVASKSWKLDAPRGSALIFAGQGTRAILWRPGDAAKKEDGALGYLALDLSPDDKAALEKALAPAKR